MVKPDRANAHRQMGSAFSSSAALFGVDDDRQAQELTLDQLEPNPFQARTDFDLKELEVLANSIREDGLLQPILCRPKPGSPGRYEIAAGERRWRACTMIGKSTILAIVDALSDKAMATGSIAENAVRNGFNPIEEADAVAMLVRRFELTLEEAGRPFGRDRSFAHVLLRIADLPKDIRDEFLDQYRGSMSHAHLAEIARAKSEDEQRRLWVLAKQGATSAQLREARDNPPLGAAAPSPAPAKRSAGFSPRRFRSMVVKVNAELAAAPIEALDEGARQGLRDLRERLNNMEL